MMKPIFILLLFVLVVPVSAVTVSFDNATCRIHIEKDIPLDNNGFLKVDASDFPQTNCSVFISTNNFATTPSYYNPQESKVTYSDEYYTLDYLERIKDLPTSWSYDMDAQLATFYELRRQTILMEKQNELLGEQNGLMRTQMGMKLKCTWMVSNGCLEYSWVTS